MVENLTSEVSVPQEDNRFSVSIYFVKKLALNRGDIYGFPQDRVSVGRYWTEGTTALNCKRKVKRIFSYTGKENRCWTVCLLNSNHRN